MPSFRRLLLDAQLRPETGVRAMYDAVLDLASSTLWRTFGAQGMDPDMLRDVAHEATTAIVWKASDIVGRIATTHPEFHQALTTMEAEACDLAATDRLLHSYIVTTVEDKAIDHVRKNRRHNHLRIADNDASGEFGIEVPAPESVLSDDPEANLDARDARRVLDALVGHAVRGRPSDVAAAWRSSIADVVALGAGRTTLAALVAISPPPDGHGGAWPPEPQSTLWKRTRDTILRRHSGVRERLHEALVKLTETGRLTAEERVIGETMLRGFKRRGPSARTWRRNRASTARAA